MCRCVGVELDALVDVGGLRVRDVAFLALESATDADAAARRGARCVERRVAEEAGVRAGYVDLAARAVCVGCGQAGVVQFDRALADGHDANRTVGVVLHARGADRAAGVDGQCAQVVVDRGQLHLCCLQRAGTGQFTGIAGMWRHVECAVRQRHVACRDEVDGRAGRQGRTCRHGELGRDQRDRAAGAFDAAEHGDLTALRTAEVERAARHEGAVADVLGAGDKAAIHVDQAVGADDDAVRVDQKHLAVGKQAAVDLRRQVAGHAIEQRGVDARLIDLNGLAVADAETLPVDDRAVGGLVDRGEVAATVDGGTAIDDLSAEGRRHGTAAQKTDCQCDRGDANDAATAFGAATGAFGVRRGGFADGDELAAGLAENDAMDVLVHDLGLNKFGGCSV